MAKPQGNGKGRRGNERGGGDGFWDRPLLINLLADVLLLAGGLILAWAGIMALQRLPILPLRELVVATPLDHVSRAQIEHTARSALTGNFLTVNLDSARSNFERMSWVRSASLRRIWPDAVELRIEEHQAVARWTPLDGEPRLVSTRGEVFAASTDEPLPRFAGPEGSAAQVLARFRAFGDVLAGAGQRPVAIQLSAREAWQVWLADGVLLELGREQAKHPLAERLDRFARHYAPASGAVKDRLPAIGAVDLRYPNGFALRGGATPPPSGKERLPPHVPRRAAGVINHLPRLAGEEARRCLPLAMPCGRLEAA